MRAKTGSHTYLIVIPLILVLASVFLFAVTGLSRALADDTVYLEADLTVGAEILPTSLVYKNDEYEFGFRLYGSTNKTYWESVEDPACLADFEILYYAVEDPTVPISKPQDVGSYIARVTAKDILSGYKNNAETPRLISEGVVVGEKRFSIVNEELSLFCTPLDRVSSLTLDDLHPDYYSAVTTGVSLLKNGVALTEGAAKDYTFVVQRHNGVGFVDVDAISTVGTYRLKVTIKSTVDLSRTAAATVLDKEADDYVMYREFSVTRATISLALTETSMYEDSHTDVSLTTASKTKLSSELSVSYNTQVILLSSAEHTGRVVASQDGGAVTHTPDEAGEYVYRVVFSGANVGYGIAIGDYLDLPFTVKKVPYNVAYRTGKSSFLDFEINRSETEKVSLPPHFTYLNGDAITSLTTGTGLSKYKVSYKKYNSGWEPLDEDDEPMGAGRYQVVVTFLQDAQIETDYTITAGTVISREFQIVTEGPLNVVPYGGGLCYYTGAEVTPELLFYAAGVEDVQSLVDEKYTVSYYDTADSPVASPIDVGEYCFEVRFTSAIPELGVTVGSAYRGAFRIVYHTISVSFGESIAFENAETGGAITPQPTYDVSYFEKNGEICKKLTEEPTLAGSYIKRLTFTTALPEYRIQVGDYVTYEYSIAGVAARCEISTSALDLVYDGGAKEPTLTFTKGTTSTLSLVRYKDYSVAYFMNDVPCGQPTLAGNYRCLVTFLRSDDEKGLTRGDYVVASYSITSRPISVSYSVSEASHDLVYDATNKTFVPRFVDGKHPVNYTNTLEYAVYAPVPDYGAAAYKSAGKYLVKTTLTDDKGGSLLLENAEMNYTIEKLSLEVKFTVPLSYSAMWTGSVVTPDVKYVALNGRYADEKTRSATDFTELGVAIGESKTYFTSDDSVHYETPVETPIKTGSYQQKVTIANDNLRFIAASALGNDGSTVTAPAYTETAAYQIYSIISREVEVKVTYDAALYYTGGDAADRKGVVTTSFKACNATGTAYDVDVSEHAFESSDYVILYYPSDYSGVISGEGSEDKPTDKGYYVARIMVAKDGVNDTYLTDGNYTFKEGKNAVGGDLGGVALYDGCYVDFVFRISDQNKLDVIYNMPNTFAANGEGKAISLTFLNNFSEVGLTEGEGKDYKITYIDADEHEQSAPYSESGAYRLKITFLKTNVAYRLESYTGTYTKANELYVSENDTLVYDFEIFEPRALCVSLIAPSSLYYDGEAKSYGVTFTVREDGVDSKVTMTYGTHYKLVYYILVDGKYEPLLGAPTLPGSYAVEVAFLTDLPDYTIEVAETPHSISTDFFKTIKGAGGVFNDAKTPRTVFTIKKAILVLGGLTPKDKTFDGTDKVVFVGSPTLTVKTEGGVSLGAMVKTDGVFPYTLTGEIKGAFHSVLPGDSVAIDVSTNYVLPKEANAFYVLEYPAYSATITKSVVTVTPVDVTREYNPLAVYSHIDYSLTYDVDTMTKVFPSLSANTILIGEMSHEEGNDVGWYKITQETLAFNDEGAGLFLSRKLSDLFTLEIEEAGYRITERLITVALAEGQSKVYGDSDPKNADGEVEYALTFLSGSLIYDDEFVCKMTRVAGENAGTYAVTLSDARVKTKSGVDVSANYRITLVNGTFEITKRRLKVSPKNQTAKYLVGFDSFDIEVLDLDRNNRDVTEEYVKKPTGDRLSGKLATKATEDPLVFSILQGTVTVVNASGKSVASNYDVDFDTSRTYTIEREEIVVRLASGAVTEKVFGEKDPLIEYTIAKTELAKLGDLILSDYSTVGRAPGEDVGEYNLYKESTPGEIGGFRVMDAGVDVSNYFKFVVNNVVLGRDKFTITPRPITITVEDETYENTGREIIPIIKYLNANGSRLSASVLSKLKLTVTVPSVDYRDGENLVTPIVVGEVQSDPNFEITFKAGTITVIFLQNRVTATPLPDTDEIYEGREYLLSGIMLYKPIKFYKLETANGEQPDHAVDIALPIDETIKGEGLVAVALYANGAPRAFAFEQNGLTLVYSDDGAYYVAIAEVQEWFYVIWGVVLIAAGVGIYFLVRLIIRVVKKQKAKQATKPKKVKAPKKPKGVDAFVPTEGATADAPISAQADLATDDLFSTEAPTEAASVSAAPIGEATVAPTEEIIQPAENTDALFSDSAPTEVISEPSAEEADVAALDFDIPAQDAFAVAGTSPLTVEEPVPEEKPKGKDKKKKDKEKEKGEKKNKKKKDALVEPKGFVPSSFKPKGDKTGAYAPTRSYQEDLFNEESSDDALLSDSAISTDDNTVSIPSSDPTPNGKGGGDDELIIARSSGFTDDDPDDPNGNGGGDSDLI